MHEIGQFSFKGGETAVANGLKNVPSGSFGEKKQRHLLPSGARFILLPVNGC